MKNKEDTNTLGIKVNPLKGVQGAYKYIKPDWTQVAYIIPRNKLNEEFIEKELQYNSIYFLLGREGLQDKVYVGQAKIHNGGGAALTRLRQHDKSKTESYRDIWKDAVVITSINGDWGATELNALENIFYNEIPDKNRLNGNEPNHSGFGTDIDYEEKVRQAKVFFKFMEKDIFEDADNIEEIHFIEMEQDIAVSQELRTGFKRVAEILTPPKQVVKMTNDIPEFMLNPYTTFLDMTCKGGEFLKELYNRLMESESLKAYYPDPIVRATYILDKQLFGIALSQESLDRANRSLYGYTEANKNIKIIPDYIDIIKHKEKEKFKQIIEREFGMSVKFNVIIGNPPYNDVKTGGGTETQQSSKQLYTYFVEMGLALESDILELIIPCRWFTELDAEYIKMRDSLSDGHLKKIIDYPDSEEVFKDISVVGGVCYFVYDRAYNGLCELQSYKANTTSLINLKQNDLIIRYKEIGSVINKVKAKAEIPLSTKVSTTSPFGFNRNSRGSEIQTAVQNIKLLSAKEITYVCLSDITKNRELVSKYKVYVGYTQSIASTGGVLSSLGILQPNEVCTLTYLILDSFDSLAEAENCLKYMKTKFVRALIVVITSTLGVTAKNYSLVPLQDFTPSSDIDWSQSIEDIDKQLYEKYSLSEEEITYIESTIKPMS